MYPPTHRSARHAGVPRGWRRCRGGCGRAGAACGCGGLLDGGEQARLEHGRAIACGITATIEVERRASAVPPHLLRHLLHRLQALRQQHHIRFMDGRHGDRRSDRPISVDERDDFLALLVWVPRIPQAIPPFVATVLVPAPCRTRRARCFAAARGATLARNACQSEPAAAHVAQTL